ARLRSARTARPPRRCTGWSGRRRSATSPWGPPWSRAGSASPAPPPGSPPCAVRSRGAELPLLRFLERLAVDAERGHRARLQPLDADVRPAVLAFAVRAVLDAPECLVDLRDELALAVADAEEEVAVAFQRGAIGRVGELLAVLPPAVGVARGDRCPRAPRRRGRGRARGTLGHRGGQVPRAVPGSGAARARPRAPRLGGDPRPTRRESPRRAGEGARARRLRTPGRGRGPRAWRPRRRGRVPRGGGARRDRGCGGGGARLRAPGRRGRLRGAAAHGAGAPALGARPAAGTGPGRGPAGRRPPGPTRGRCGRAGHADRRRHRRG